MTGNLIVHIGAPKCGSSSVQAALSQKPDFTGRDGAQYKYVCLRANGSVVQGQMLRRKATASRYLYAASPNITSQETADTILNRNAAAVAALRAEGINVILSSEGWIHHAKIFEDSEFLLKAGGNAQVVAFVRPGIDWFNSAWWQWGVWGGRTVERFLNANKRSVCWPTKLESWATLPGVERLDVGLTSMDAVAGFYDLLNAVPPQFKNANAGVPPAFLHFLLRNREYRPSAHDASYEFIVGRSMPAQRIPTPWALTPSLVQKTMQDLHLSSKNLMPFLAPRERAAVENDARWWTADAYADKVVSEPKDYETAQSLSDLLRDLTPKTTSRQTRKLNRAITEIENAPSEHVIETADRHICLAVDAIKRRDDFKRIWQSAFRLRS